MEMVVFILQNGEARDGDREDGHASNDARRSPTSACVTTSRSLNFAVYIIPLALATFPRPHINSYCAISHSYLSPMTRLWLLSIGCTGLRWIR